MIQPLLRTLRSAGPLSSQSETALKAVFSRTVKFRRHDPILYQGENPDIITALLSGMALRSKVLESGKRQITSVVVPGDLCDLSAVFFHQLDYGIEAATDCEVAVAKRQTVIELLVAHGDIGRALWRATLMNESISREWVVNLGRRQAHQRIAHFLCEIFVRTEPSDPSDERALPLTQDEIADVAGLTVVHVNRVIQDLRSAGIISFQHKCLVVHDWDRLRATAGFDPHYLHRDEREPIT